MKAGRLCFVGKGRLMDEVLFLLEGNDKFEIQVVDHFGMAALDKAEVVISLKDSFQLEEELALQTICRTNGLFFFSCYIDMSLGFVGPWVHYKDEGCLACFHERRMKVLGHTQRRMLQTSRQNPKEVQLHPISILPHIQVLSQIIVEELERWGEAKEAPFINSVFVLSALTLLGERHKFFPDPLCMQCSQIPNDTAALAQIHFQPQLKKNPWEFRISNPKLNLINLRKEFFDWRTGLVSHIYRDRTSTAMPLQIAELPLYSSDNRENGVGRTFNFKDSEFTAILEAIERYGGCFPHGKRTNVRGSYNQLKENAINPVDLGLHHPDFYENPEFTLVPYSPFLEFDWVWGYSFKHNKSVLVPEQAVYYRLNKMRPSFNKEWFIYEISNGCAMGSSREEAILHGLLEVIERDAFLLAWYGQLGVTELQLEDVRDKRILMIKDAVESLGYDVYFFDITSDLEIPSVWAIAVNPANEGVKTYSAAGAHFDPEKAIMGALVEVATSVSVYHNNPMNRREEGLKMLQHEELIRTIDDHVLLYTLPEAFDRFDFLFQDDRKKASVNQAYSRWYNYSPDIDLTKDLTGLIERITKELDLDVIVIDQTTREQENLGLVTVKVIVTGTLSMTFGALFHRTYQNERLLNVPYKLGYWDRPKKYEELKIIPHPFP